LLLGDMDMNRAVTVRGHRVGQQRRRHRAQGMRCDA
jgi:hypothetical protein